MTMPLLPLLLVLGGTLDTRASDPLVYDAAAPEQAIHIILPGAELRASDIAFVGRDEDMVVARLPARASTVLLTEDKRHALLTNRKPGRDWKLRHGGVLRVERGAIVTKPQPGGPCFAARIELSPGTYITRADAVEAECRAGAVERRLGYDANAAAPVARATIPAGSYLGRLQIGSETPVAAGRALLLRTRVGPVIVERAVTSLHPGQPGQRVWVRTADGQLASSMLAAGPGGESK